MNDLLTNCDKEPIHIPGSIQPHGAMIVFDAAHLSVSQFSANLGLILGFEGLDSETVDRLCREHGLRALLQGQLDQHPRFIPLAWHPQRRIRHNALLHRSPDGQLVLEMERVLMDHEGDIASNVWFELKNLIPPIEACDSLDIAVSEACKAVRKLTGYDRVMIYRFHDDLHGEVVAEEKLNDLESWLGLHYPASDIPAQARKLYQLNWIRMIPDVRYQPVPLSPAVSPVTGRPLDMTYCHLRSVSPVHIQYLKNMGTGASLSLSLITPRGLWGLISCHNIRPRFVSYFPRELCQSVSKRLSSALWNKEFEGLAWRQEQLVAFCSNLRDGILNIALLKQLIPCEKVIVTEPLAMALELEVDSAFRRHLAGVEAPLHAVSQLSNGEFPGALALRVSGQCWLVLLRREHIKEVRWAGDPNKPVLGEAENLQPRTSFLEWKESVRGRSKEWSSLDLEFAAHVQKMLSGQLNLEGLQKELSNKILQSEQFVSGLQQSLPFQVP